MTDLRGKGTDEDAAGAPRILTAEQRRDLLGKVAEFEYQLLALSPNRQAFVLAYLADPTDGTRAARKAGYSEARVGITASELLHNPKVLSVIALGEQLREDRTMITSDRTLNELALIAFSDIADYKIDYTGQRILPRDGVPEYVTRAISSLEVEETSWTDDEGNEHVKRKARIRLWDKTTALRMLAVYQKLLSGDGLGGNVDARSYHIHNHQHNTWQIGDKVLTF